LAVFDRFDGLWATAFAAPRFKPATGLNATAAGFLLPAGVMGGGLPKASIRMLAAIWFKSWALLDCFGIGEFLNTMGFHHALARVVNLFGIRQKESSKFNPGQLLMGSFLSAVR